MMEIHCLVDNFVESWQISAEFNLLLFFQIDGCVVRTSGEPGRAIIKIARGEGADYLVMGSRGVGTLRKTFMGSVSDYVVHHAHIPVTVVRNRDEDNK